MGGSNSDPGTNDTIGVFQGNLVTHLSGDNMERVHCNSEGLNGYPLTHFGGDDNQEEVHCNSDKLHGFMDKSVDELHRFPLTHFGGDDMEGARDWSDRLHEIQKDISNTQRKGTILGDRLLEASMADVVT